MLCGKCSWNLESCWFHSLLKHILKKFAGKWTKKFQFFVAFVNLYPQILWLNCTKHLFCLTLNTHHHLRVLVRLANVLISCLTNVLWVVLLTSCESYFEWEQNFLTAERLPPTRGAMVFQALLSSFLTLIFLERPQHFKFCYYVILAVHLLSVKLNIYTNFFNESKNM